MRTITFDSSVKKQILGIFDKQVDAEGYIVEKNNPGQRVLTPDGDDIHLDEFTGIYKGSEIFVKSDIVSLVELSNRLE